MDSIINFIKNFHPSQLGLRLWDVLLLIGITVAVIILIHWLTSFFPPRTRDSIKGVIRWTSNIIAHALIVLLTLNAILTGDYTNIFVIALLFVSSKLDYWYKLYDNFVDRQVNKER